MSLKLITNPALPKVLHRKEEITSSRVFRDQVAEAAGAAEVVLAHCGWWRCC